jgi:anthranilate phosphoribosyltransferase
VRRLVSGEQGPVRDSVLLNAAAAIAAMSTAGGSLAEELSAGMSRAAEAIDSGAAADVLARWTAVSGELAAKRNQ